MLLECLQCKNSFSPRHKAQKKFCSTGCRQAFFKQQRLAVNPTNANSPSTTGAISELVVAVDLMRRGLAVFRALSPACPCDLAVLRDQKLIRIEVKTVWKLPSGKLSQSADSITHILNTNCDVLALVHNGSDVTYIPDIWDNYQINPLPD